MMERLLELLSGPGVLGTRAPLFPDVIVLALVLVLPLFAWGFVLVRRGRTRAHAYVMGATMTTLVLVVFAFSRWLNTVGYPKSPALEAAPFYKTFYLRFLAVHIAIAVGALLLGSGAMLAGLALARRGPDGELRLPPKLAKVHRIVGRLALAAILYTSVSGSAIYYLRYVYGG